MNEYVINGLFVIISALLTGIGLEAYKRYGKKQDDYDDEEQELSRESILDHQKLAEKMLAKCERHEEVERKLQDELRAKDATIARLETKVEFLEDRLKLRGGN